MTSVMIIQESDLLRGALAAVLSHEPDLDVTAQLPVADDVSAFARAARPDVVVIHIERCDEDGLATLRRLSLDAPGAAVLVVTGRHTVEALRAALDAGVHGFLDADTAPEALVDAVRRLAIGERVIDPMLLVAALREDDNPLTPRQRDVLRLAGEGLSTREIGRRLYLSPGTVRNYLSAAIRRVGGRSLLEAVGRATKEGWL
jgi:two-component system response regulator DesR